MANHPHEGAGVIDRRQISGLTSAMEEATEWFVRQHENPGDDQWRPQFEAWREADPSHAAAYERVQRLWGASAHLPALAVAPARPDRRAVLAGVVGIGGGALAAAGAGRLALGPHPFADYRTRVGEVAKVTLEDGSDVALSTATALGVHFTRKERRVHLLEGEAWFQTASDPERPLMVEVAGRLVSAADAATFGIRALGRRGHLSVAVHSVDVGGPGRIERLEAGRTAEFGADGLERAAALDPADFAWRDGRLVFVNRPLGEVARTLDRWTGARTLVRGDDLAARPVTLITRTRDAAKGLEQLQQATPLSIERLGPLTIVRAI